MIERSRDPGILDRTGSMEYTLGQIAELVEGRVVGDAGLLIAGIAKIEEAKEGEITFIARSKYAKFFEETKASAVIVGEDFPESEGKAIIRTRNPYHAFLKIIEAFYPEKPVERGIHETAVISEDAVLGKGVAVGPNAVIGRRCKVGDGTVIMPGVIVGDDVVIGPDCVIHARVSLREGVILGSRVTIHDGAVVGSDGFGFAPEEGKYYKIPQVGNVVIEDDVEIGANTTIDRATLGETRIKRGAKLDNLIQVGHNCTIGEDTVIAAQAGLSGSTDVGQRVRIGGQVGFAGHLKVGDDAAIGAQSGVSKTVRPGNYMFGYPAKPYREEFRIQGALRRLPELLKEVKELREKVRRLEEEKGKGC